MHLLLQCLAQQAFISGPKIQVIFLHLYLLVANFVFLLITFTNRLDPDQARQKVGLIWIQAVKQSDVIPEQMFKKMLKNICSLQKIMINYPALYLQV